MLLSALYLYLFHAGFVYEIQKPSKLSHQSPIQYGFFSPGIQSALNLQQPPNISETLADLSSSISNGITGILASKLRQEIQRNKSIRHLDREVPNLTVVVAPSQDAIVASEGLVQDPTLKMKTIPCGHCDCGRLVAASITECAKSGTKVAATGRRATHYLLTQIHAFLFQFVVPYSPAKLC